MNASKAKRRLIRWMRYLDHTASLSGNKNHGGYHMGHARAYADASFAKRYAPKGIRSPWTRTSRLPYQSYYED